MNTELIAEARALVQRQADAAPRSVRVHILAGNTEDDRTRLLVQLTNALEAAEIAFGAIDTRTNEEDVPLNVAADLLQIMVEDGGWRADE